MSEMKESTPAPSPAGPSATRPSRWKKWRRRLKLTFLTLLLLFAIFRVALQFMLPTVLRRTAASYGFAASYERHEMDLFGGDVGIWHLVLAPAEGGAPLLKTDYCRGDVSTWDLLRGRLVVRRLEAEGIDVLVERDAKGEIAILKKFAAASAAKATHAGAQSASPSAPQVTAKSAIAATPKEIDLTSPFQMDAFRLDRVHAHIRDLSVSPPLDAAIDLNLRVTDLRSPIRPSGFDLEMSARPLLDSLRAKGEGRAAGKDLDAKMQVVISGLHPRPASGYLQPLGIKPVARDLSLAFNWQITTSAAKDPGALAAKAMLDQIYITADGEDVAGLDHLGIEARSISATLADVASIWLDGGHCAIERSAEGGLRIAGVELIPTAKTQATTQGISIASASPAPAPANINSSAAATSSPATQPALPIYAWTIDKIDVSHLRAELSDQAVRPAANVGLALDHLNLTHLTNDPSRATVPINLSAALLAPGIAKSIQLNGTAALLTEPQTANLLVKVDGIKPDALRPYLDAAGLDCQLKSGTLACSLTASIAKGIADAQLKDVKFTDGPELLALNNVHIAGFHMGSADQRIRIDAIDIGGPEFKLGRNASGQFEACGFRFKPPSTPALASLAIASASPAGALENVPRPAPASLPKFDIGRLSWKGIHLRYEDKAVTPATSLAMEDAGVEITNLRLDVSPNGPALEPAHINAWLKTPGLAGDVRVAGIVTPRADGSTIDLDLVGNAITAEPIGAYLKNSGIEAVLRDGSLHMHLNAKFRQNADGSVASISTIKLSDLQLKDPSGELVGVDGLSIDGFDSRADATEFGKIKIDKPRVHLTREKDGTFSVAGIHTLPPAPPATPAVIAPAPQSAVLAPPAQNITKPAATAPAPAAVSIIRSLELNDAALQWTDNATPAPTNLSATVSVQLDHFTYGGKAEPADLKVRATIAGAVEHLTLEGRVVPSPTAPDAHLIIAADGVRAGALAAYLPPTMQSTLKDGRFKAAIDAGMSPNAKGGAQGRAILSDLDFRDGETGPALLHLDTAAIRVNRYDPAGKVIALDEISVKGLEADLQKSPNGMRLMGLAMVPAKAALAPPPAPIAAPKVDPKEPIAAPVPDAPQPAPPAAASKDDIARMVAANRLDLPLITLARLSIAVRHLQITDIARPTAAPIAIDDLELTSQKIEMLGTDPENRPPIDLDLKCRPAPLADSLSVNARIAPFALKPNAKITFATTGIRGSQLLSAFPELKEQIDASPLTDGRLKAELKAELKIDRRDLLRLDFSRPFDADLSLKGLEFRNGDGPLLAGVEEFRSDAVHIEPKTGGIHAKAMEVSNLAAGVVKEKDGIHILGLILRAPATQPVTLVTTQPATQPAVAVAIVPATQSTTRPAETPAVAIAPATRPAGEIRLDALIVSGMNFRLEDRTVDPPLVVPVTSLDLEARELSNYLMYDADRSMRFSLLINAGKIALPKPGKKLAAETAEASKTTQPATQPIAATEDRELFSQLTASGKMSLYPAPKGWIKVSLSGLELAALKGEAKQAGFDLSGGTFDANVDARFSDAGSLDLRPRFAFVDLGIAEPNKGPIEKYFALPLSLDGAVSLLQDASGQITLPLHVVVEQGKVDTGSVVGSAVGAITGVIVTAVASAPLKGVMGAASLIGIDLNKKKVPPPPQPFAFDPAGTALAQANGGLSKELIERLREDQTIQITLRHDLGSSDVKRVSQRANPAGEDALALAYQLRQGKMELLKERAQMAGQARGEMGSGLNADATIERLRNIERELAVTEDGLDDLNELTRPGAGRQAIRRTRAACIAIGEQRLIAARDMLASLGIPDLAHRLRVSHAKFNPDDDLDTGRVMMTMTLKAK